jgi:hypothetical protein
MGCRAGRVQYIYQLSKAGIPLKMRLCLHSSGCVAFHMNDHPNSAGGAQSQFFPKELFEGSIYA